MDDWRQTPAARKGAVCAAWLVVLALVGGLAAQAAVAFARGTEGDFIHFYEAARAVRAGDDLYDSGSRGYIYPPLFAIFLTPLTLLSFPAAGIAWTAFNAVMVVWAGWVLARETARRFDLPPSWSAACMLASGLLLNADKVRAVLSLGQTDALTLLLVALALAWQTRRPGLAGVLLGLAFNIKYQAVIFLPYFLFRRRFVEAFATLASSAAGLLAGGLVFGWDRNTHYLARAFAGLLEMAGIHPAIGAAAQVHPITWDRSVSITSALARLAEAAGWSRLAFPTALLVASVVAGGGWWVMRRWGVPLLAGRGADKDSSPERAPVVLLEWVGLVVGVLLFSPQTTNRHLYLLTFLSIPGAGLLLLPAPRVRRGFLAAGLVVLFAGLTLPPGGARFAEALAWWRGVAGASWCALFLFFTVLWTGMATAGARSHAWACGSTAGRKPVPAGIRWPSSTFSFRPASSSTLP